MEFITPSEQYMHITDEELNMFGDQVEAAALKGLMGEDEMEFKLIRSETVPSLPGFDGMQLSFETYASEVDNFFQIKAFGFDEAGDVSDSATSVAQAVAWVTDRAAVEGDNVHDFSHQPEEIVAFTILDFMDHQGFPREPIASLEGIDRTQKLRNVVVLDQLLVPADVNNGVEFSLVFLQQMFKYLNDCSLIALDPPMLAHGVPFKPLDSRDAEVVQIARHFARLGFRHVMSGSQDSASWVKVCNGDANLAITPPEEVQDLDVFIPPQAPVLGELEQEIVTLIGKNEFDGIGDLVKKGADLDLVRGIHRCVTNNNVQGVKKMLALGIDVNQQDELGNTPLHVAGKCVSEWEDFGNFKLSMEILGVLLEAGADKTIKNLPGENPHEFCMRAKMIHTDFLRMFEGLESDVGRLQMLQIEKFAEKLKVAEG